MARASLPAMSSVAPSASLPPPVNAPEPTNIIVGTQKTEPRTFVPPPRRFPPFATLRPEFVGPPLFSVRNRVGKTPPVSSAMRRDLEPPPAPTVPQVAVAKTAAPVVMLADATPTRLPPMASAKVTELKSPAEMRASDLEPLPAKRNTNGDRSLTRALGLKLGRVVLDAGHGGHDVGTLGVTGLKEKDLVLDVTQRLGDLLEARLVREVVYTRATDVFIPLEERTQIANDRKADLFLSIHANSSPFKAAVGVETYYLNFTTSKAALDVAARENAGSDRSIFDLKELLQKIALKDKIDESREFAARLQTSLYGVASKSTAAAAAASARNRGTKKAPFIVLIGAQMPSVLAEIGFVSNPAEEALLKKPEYRQKIAESLYRGIAAYAETLSHPQQVAKRGD
jgi:N-acetylmuramoyl-L-alanine amidase